MPRGSPALPSCRPTLLLAKTPRLPTLRPTPRRVLTLGCLRPLGLRLALRRLRPLHLLVQLLRPCLVGLPGFVVTSFFLPLTSAQVQM